MLEVVDLYHRAGQEFTDRANRIGDRWSAATPCEDWDVRALVHHIVEEERWAPLLLAGATIADVGDRLAGELLGDAPLIALDDAAAQAAPGGPGPPPPGGGRAPPPRA